MLKDMWYGALLVYFSFATLRLCEGADFRGTDSSGIVNINDANVLIQTDKMGPWVKVGDKSFFINSFYKANWYNASTYCAFYNMKLATILTKAEEDALLSYFDRNGYGTDAFWVFGTDLANKERNHEANPDHFSWMSTGKSLDYSNWADGQPSHDINSDNGEVAHCIEINHCKKWNDDWCSSALNYFVCERLKKKSIV